MTPSATLPLTFTKSRYRSFGAEAVNLRIRSEKAVSSIPVTKSRPCKYASSAFVLFRFFRCGLLLMQHVVELLQSTKLYQVQPVEE